MIVGSLHCLHTVEIAGAIKLDGGGGEKFAGGDRLDLDNSDASVIQISRLGFLIRILLGPIKFLAFYLILKQRTAYVLRLTVDDKSIKTWCLIECNLKF